MKPPLCPHGVRAWTISAENFREVRRALCAAFSIYPGIVVRPPEGALYRYGVQIRDRKRGLVNFALPDDRSFYAGERIDVRVPSFDDQFAYPVRDDR